MTLASLDPLRRPPVHPAPLETQPMPRGLRRPHLSPREIEVLLHWLRCDSKNEVAAGLFLSIGTVNTHLARIRTKYREVGRSAPTKAALVARAVQDGLIELHEL